MLISTAKSVKFCQSVREIGLPGDRKLQLISLQSFLREGVSLGYVGLNQNLKDLTDTDTRTVC